MKLEIKIKKQLKDFLLDVDIAGDVSSLGILGESGSGKSMTLKCIAGIETPDSGRIVIDDQVYFDSEQKINLKPQQRKVGFLFQNYALFPNMTINENIACVLTELSKSERQKRTDELLVFFQLEGLGNRYPGQLSGGQQQRAAFARILAYEPNVLLLDEPFSALDSQLKEILQLQFLEMLKIYNGTIIMVTHSREEVYRLCQELMVIVDGHAVIHGDTKELFIQPQLLQVAKLTGCKNHAAIKKIDDYTLKVLDWGVELKVSEPISEKITHIGIRAHDFVSVSHIMNNESNLIPVYTKEVMESPFEWIVLVKSKFHQTSCPEIWWKTSKKSNPPFQEGVLQVPSSAIMLLRSE